MASRELRPAPLSARAAGLAIDLVVAGTVAAVLAFLTFSGLDLELYSSEAEHEQDAIVLYLGGVLFAVAGAAAVACAAPRGSRQTLGMWVTRVWISDRPRANRFDIAARRLGAGIVVQVLVGILLAYVMGIRVLVLPLAVVAGVAAELVPLAGGVARRTLSERLAHYESVRMD